MKKHVHIIGLFLFIFLTMQVHYIQADSVKNTSEYRDSFLRANLSDLRVYAELYWDKEFSYKGVCSSKEYKDIFNIIKKDLKGKIICNSSEKAFVIESQIKRGKGYYCVDSTGTFTVNKKSQGKKAVSCAPVIKDKTSITKNEHFISGTINSPVKVITYTDFECPFCKQFHNTIKKLSSGYGDKVAFIYRHYPLRQIHPNAELAANATECAAKLGAGDKFVEYVSSVFDIAPNFDVEKLADLSGDIGITEKTFASCLKSRKYSKEVQKDITAGDKIVKADEMFGTPYSLIYGPKGEVLKIIGSQPIETVKTMIDKVLAQ